MRRSSQRPFLWSLQAVVALVFTLVVLAISGALIGFNHRELRSLALQEAEDDFRHIADNIRNELAGSLQTAGSVLDTMALTVDPELAPEQLAPVLLAILKDLDRVLPAATGIFVSRGDGSALVVQMLDAVRPPEIGTDIENAAFAYMIVEAGESGRTVRWIVSDDQGRELRRIEPQPTDFDPRKRPWYAPSLASTGMILTPPYRFANVPEAGLTLARQARQKAGAVFGIDMTLASLDRHLDRLRIPPELELLIYDTSGALIAHPHGGTYRLIGQADQSDRLLTVDDLGSPLLSAMVRTVPEGPERQERSTTFSVDGKTYFGRIERAGGKFDNLFISLAVPYETLLGPAERIRTTLLAVSSASVLIALLLVLLAARGLAKPLQRAADDIRRIMRFEFGHPRKARSSIAEVQELSRAIDTLELAISNFMRYVPTSLVRGIIGRKFSSELGGRRQPVTVLFSDVAGFTTMAEDLDPEVVMAKISRYFSEVGSELVRSGATIDKYIGDSIMAFWNAPEERAEHVSLACLGALRAARRLDRLNAEFIAEGGAPMPTRFGLHTGEAVIGNVGSVDRINYTALGHTVNMASRIEQMNKRYGTTILVSEDVRNAVRNDFVFRTVDKVVPAGAQRGMLLYELLGTALADEPDLAPPPECLETLDKWEMASERCLAGDWEEASAKLQELVAIAPEDRLFQTHLMRCRANLAVSQAG